MAKNFVMSGDVVDVAAAPSGGVASGAPVLIGDLLGVPQTSAAEGEPFTMAVTGVHDLPANTHASSQAIADGAIAYWDASTKAVTATKGTNKPIGHVVGGAKASTSAIARVRLQQGGVAAAA
ncbi:MAG TPA: DUF2190 family protein [Phenylobacterium sp.]|nr:DUF2190 family protein [Phenylobacterium sp.]